MASMACIAAYDELLRHKNTSLTMMERAGAQAIR
eukprot:CAMPEP_0119354860 /NCGR_PEP_ID=MMETSP1334-20130426/3839_1 /TAXON_ID=127549 /ORGANISM="Calcidiscus leptoporus, Strain RCC1130" /LENGTH=33 /DNA_ID= /DNA_START= /DNA_END= /DNA_ORIENTATION=